MKTDRMVEFFILQKLFQLFVYSVQYRNEKIIGNTQMLDILVMVNFVFLEARPFIKKAAITKVITASNFNETLNIRNPWLTGNYSEVPTGTYIIIRICKLHLSTMTLLHNQPHSVQDKAYQRLKCWRLEDRLYR